MTRILIVDDDSKAAEELHKVLASLLPKSVVIVVAASLGTAEDMMKELPYDLVITELCLLTAHESLNIWEKRLVRGIDLLQAIRAGVFESGGDDVKGTSRNVELLVWTVNGDNSALNGALPFIYKPSFYFTKPCYTADFVRAVKGLLNL